MKKSLRCLLVTFLISVIAGCGSRSGPSLPDPITRNDALLVLRATLAALGSTQDVDAACPQGGTVTREDVAEGMADYSFDACRFDGLTLTGFLGVTPGATGFEGFEYDVSVIGEPSTPGISGSISTDDDGLLTFNIIGQGLETSQQITVTGTATINEDGTLDGTLTLSYEGEEITECPLDDVDLINSSCGDYADLCGLDVDDFC